jgi:hypothetical protein
MMLDIVINAYMSTIATTVTAVSNSKREEGEKKNERKCRTEAFDRSTIALQKKKEEQEKERTNERKKKSFLYVKIFEEKKERRCRIRRVGYNY